MKTRASIQRIFAVGFLLGSAFLVHAATSQAGVPGDATPAPAEAASTEAASTEGESSAAIIGRPRCDERRFRSCNTECVRTCHRGPRFSGCSTTCERNCRSRFCR